MATRIIHADLDISLIRLINCYYIVNLTVTPRAILDHQQKACKNKNTQEDTNRYGRRKFYGRRR